MNLLVLFLISYIFLFCGSLASTVTTVDSKAVVNATDPQSIQWLRQHSQMRRKRDTKDDDYWNKLVSHLETFEFCPVNRGCEANLRYSNDYSKIEHANFFDCIVKCFADTKCVAMTHISSTCFLYEQKVENHDDVSSNWKSCWWK